MRICDGLREWFSLPERLVIFTFGLLFSKGMMRYVLQNLMAFLTDSWKLKLGEAATIVNIQEGLWNMLQIFVAFCIDTCFGYRRMLILSSVLYSAGLGLLAFSVPRYFFHDKEVCPAEKVNCLKMLKHTPFWEGLALLIAGGAAQVIPLKSLSFDQTGVVKVPEHSETRVTVGCGLLKVKKGGGRQLQQRIIRWFCIAFFMLGTITSVSGFIFLELEWQQNFLISAIVIASALLWFLCGFPFYGPRRLQQSPLSTMLRVLTAAVRKKNLNCQDQDRLHRCDGDGQNEVLTDHLKFLNNAVKGSAADDNSTMAETRWKPCTVKEVEQTKHLLNMIPISATFIMYGMVQSLGNTFFIEQAYRMKDDTGNEVVVLQIIQWFSEHLVLWVYKLVFEKRITRLKGRYSDGVKIGIGMLASIACCAVASSFESKRLKALRQTPISADAIAPISADAIPPTADAVAPISAFWLVPQFFFLGAMEGLAGDGIQDFFGHYAPDSRRYGPVFARSLIGFGTILNMGFIAILEYYSKSRYKESWLGDSVNQSRLDFIYRAYAIVALLNCFLYGHVSSRYTYDNIIGKPEEEEEIPFLEVKEGDQGQVNVELRQISVWD